MNDEQIARVARALSHPARVRIVRLLATQPECRGAEVFSELPLAQSTISQHLSVLKEAGLVGSHAVGSSNVYCLTPAAINLFAEEVAAIVQAAPKCTTSTRE